MASYICRSECGEREIEKRIIRLNEGERAACQIPWNAGRSKHVSKVILIKAEPRLLWNSTCASAYYLLVRTRSEVCEYAMRMMLQ